MEISTNSKPMSNRALKREIARAIATIRFQDRVIEEQKTYYKKARYKSGSWVTVKPRAKVTDSRYYRYNRGDYVCYNIGYTWLWHDKANNF